MNIHAPTIESAVPVAPIEFDFARAIELAMTIMHKAEILEDLGKLEIESGNDSRLACHAQHLGSEVADTSCELFDMLFRVDDSDKN
jgi:hypothetical protein